MQSPAGTLGIWLLLLQRRAPRRPGDLLVPKRLVLHCCDVHHQTFIAAHGQVGPASPKPPTPEGHPPSRALMLELVRQPVVGEHCRRERAEFCMCPKALLAEFISMLPRQLLTVTSYFRSMDPQLVSDSVTMSPKTAGEAARVSSGSIVPEPALQCLSESIHHTSEFIY